MIKDFTLVRWEGGRPIPIDENGDDIETPDSFAAMPGDIDLDELEKKNDWSGFDREKSVKIIRKLIAELRRQRIVVETLVETLDNIEKDARAAGNNIPERWELEK